MAHIKNVFQATDTNFESDVLGGEGLSLVDFWAEWCGPCRMLAPTIEAIAGQYDGKLKVFKMNVDENPNTPAQFNIRGIPTVIFFKGGKAVDQLIGNQPKEAFIQAIEKQM
ncbi:MAG TPA: thioredoxin [Bdellovibrionota bacterium]|jgi:thioredoxin 1|nr:thioredoxin [Bdellovibrionota bacterium]